MALILCLETATTVCSVALGKDGAAIAMREVNAGYTHSENLTVFVQQLLEEAGFSFADLDAIAVSKGPGSYTGLRIGVSAAKGFCFALDKPLIAINTLEGMAAAVKGTETGHEVLCPMLDARRMEVYCAFYDRDGNEVRPTSAEIITETSFSDILSGNRVIFFGDGAAKCKPMLQSNPNAIFLDEIYPSAQFLVNAAEMKFRSMAFEDVAYFEPYYLKDFVAGPAKR